MTRPAIVLMGSGEFLPWAREPDAWALEAASADSDRVIVLPTASAPEGDAVFDRWGRMGLEHFEGLGVRPEVLPVKTRADADDPANARAASGARYIFFSGGNPAYLAHTLAGTTLWRAVLDAVAGGAAFGGCSAGMVALGMTAPDTAAFAVEPASDDATARRVWQPGLGVFPAGYLQAHWDALDGYYPGLRQRILDAQPDGSLLFAVDEDTAASGDGSHWRITGAGALTISGNPEIRAIPAGTEVTFSLGLTLA